jgi:membrane protein
MTLRQIGTLFVEAGRHWIDDCAPRMSAALAFYTIFSMTPLFIITTAIVGFALGEEAARGEIVAQLEGIIGVPGAEVIQTMLEHASEPQAGRIASLLGLVMLLLGAVAVFAELQDDLNTVWKASQKKHQTWLGWAKDRLPTFAMVLAVGFLLLVSLILSALLVIVGTWIQTFLPRLGMSVLVLNILISVSVATGLFALMFRYIPAYRLPWNTVLIGAALTAAFFVVGKYLIGVYVGRAGIASPFGAAGSVVVLVVWVYYSALIFFYGAEITQALERKWGAHKAPLDVTA